MKILITAGSSKGSRYVDEDSIGQVHLLGPMDETACGLALEMYRYSKTKEPITCTTCKGFLEWAKAVTKKVKS